MSKDPIRPIYTGLIGLDYDLGRRGADGWFGKDTKAKAQAWLLVSGAPAPTPQTPAPHPAGGAVIRQGSAGHPVHEIIVHCSATSPDWMAGQPLAGKVTKSAAGTGPKAGAKSAITGSSTAMARFWWGVPTPKPAPMRSTATPAPSEFAC